MNRIVSCIILFIFCISAKSQNLKFAPIIGYEGRYTFYQSPPESYVYESVSPGAFQDLTPHLQGNALNLGIEMNFIKFNLTLQYRQSIRYDYLYDLMNFPDTTYLRFGIGTPIYRFIIDHHFSLNKLIDLNKDYSLKFGLGYSLMNNNTRFLLTEQIGYFAGRPVTSSEHRDFKFNAISFQAGIVYKNFNPYLNFYYFSKHNHNFTFPSNFVLASIGINYKFDLKKFQK